jgi:hypothetical protein
MCWPLLATQIEFFSLSSLIMHVVKKYVPTAGEGTDAYKHEDIFASKIEDGLSRGPVLLLHHPGRKERRPECPTSTTARHQVKDRLHVNFDGTRSMEHGSQRGSLRDLAIQVLPCPWRRRPPRAVEVFGGMSKWSGGCGEVRTEAWGACSVARPHQCTPD